MSDATSDKTLITFWGTRGSISTPGRTTEKYGGNTSCIYVRHGNTHVVLDAGTGIRPLGFELIRELADEEDPVIHLLLTHTHWDHIQGLPFFDPAYTPGIKVLIYGSHTMGGFLEQILRRQMDSEYFPVEMSAFGAELDIREIREENFTIGPINFDWQEQYYHPGGSVRFGLSVNDRRFVYATDIEINKMIGPDADKTDEAKARAEEYLKFIEGADLLVADGQYTTEEYKEKVGWGHSSVPLVLKTAYAQNVKQVALFHHDPVHSDDFLDDLWQEHSPSYTLADPSMGVFWAREGLTLSI